MLRIGKTATPRRSASSSTARSTATRSRPRASASRPRSGSCATTGRDAETTALVDGLDIFIVPQINGDGAAHSLYDSNRRTNLSNHCEDTIRFPSKETDPAARNNWGVDLNRNFSQGSVFDGYFGAIVHGLHERQLRGPVRVLRARDPQRVVGADHVPEHQVRQQHPLVRRLLHVAARRLHRGRPRPAAVSAVRDAELLRPDGQGGARPDQVAPRHGDPAAADRSRDRRPLLRGRQQRRRGVLQQRHHRLRLRDRGPALQRHRLRACDLQPGPAAAVRTTRRTTASTTRASTRRWSSRPATTACSRRRSSTPTTRRRPASGSSRRRPPARVTTSY